MSTYRVEIDSSWPVADAFDYMARFSNAAKWDPGVLGAEDLDQGLPRLASVYRLQIKMLGRPVPLDYRIVELDRPKRVVLEAQNSMICSRDAIEVTPAGPGASKVTYSATLTGRGLAALASPLLALALRRLGDRAAAGLRAALSSPLG